ncbi:hypothetical protein CLV96_1133 [Leptospira meyeri]|uniref:Uncharacterized protein n=1 Tax=Leptospira meyeri TaxID=29508 RepID=A0A4R8MWJ3_LEPME|nr:hypothetical protein [Leptospira meyeri]EKJ85199.1 hypothetical protein LEP1GSC017_2821 [Leptospira meyeri serovar Hardjo str. Went 5]TDY72147.1 hypothetical protein CLV96_1133 [Leptospira meyeri]
MLNELFLDVLSRILLQMDENDPIIVSIHRQTGESEVCQMALN